ncbi:MAG: S41 family peptidase, partial [Cyanobacteria bacterium J06638_6]
GGQRLSEQLSPHELLVHQADCPIQLTVADGDGQNRRTLTVNTLKDDRPLRYREWVERNYQTVAEATSGRIGYVHIPDMGPAGYAEFHRYYFAEVAKQGLLVDVRFNRGGHVSQLILEKLARRRIGYDVPRWEQPDPYPSGSILGPIVAITNEHAGSDGDIFSHCFKLMNIGPLIGTRTWGGVIGISPKHRLVDLGLVTQPEYSFWFEDVGWRVENYGTDPDIPVDISPQDWAAGNDPQLDRAIRVILEELENNPVKLPDFSDRPQLHLP